MVVRFLPERLCIRAGVGVLHAQTRGEEHLVEQIAGLGLGERGHPIVAVREIFGGVLSGGKAPVKGAQQLVALGGELVLIALDVGDALVIV